MGKAWVLKEGQLTQRFEFGENWQRFLNVLDDERITAAEKSLRTMLTVEDLKGKSFLDIGSGSGLFSLAALRLGAARVRSFDRDPLSVACARELKRRYRPEASHWVIEEGSVLDATYLGGLGQFDIVYSWGVLHHTGQMWQAMQNVSTLVVEGGMLFVAIYNTQAHWTAFWRTMKRWYTHSPQVGKWMILGAFSAFQMSRGLLVDLVSLRNPVRRYLDHKRPRGMSVFHDWMDWAGGYPFETAKPEEVFDFFRARGFVLERLTTSGGSGCNQFVFSRPANHLDPQGVNRSGSVKY